MTVPNISLLRQLEDENRALLIGSGMDGTNVVRTTTEPDLQAEAWPHGENEIIFNLALTSDWDERTFRATNYRVLSTLIYAPRVRGKFAQLFKDMELYKTLGHLEAGRCATYLAAREFYAQPNGVNFSLFWRHQSILEGLTHFYLPKLPDSPLSPDQNLLNLARQYMAPWKNHDRAYNRTKIGLVHQIHGLLADDLPSSMPSMPLHGLMAEDEVQFRDLEIAKSKFK